MSNRLFIGICALFISGFVCIAQISPVHVPVTGPIISGATSFSTWNPADKSAPITLSGGNLIANGTGTQGSVRGTKSWNTGIKYFEIGTSSTAGSSTMIGIATSSANLSTFASGLAVNGYGGLPSAGTFFNGGSAGYTVAYLAGGHTSFTIDFGNLRAWMRTNAGNWNNNGSANPCTNVGGTDISTVFMSNPAFPIATLDTSSQTFTLNVGASAFSQTIPACASPWNFLLKRDLAPYANDNTPMFVEVAA